jgi:hypothetical protein
MLPFTIAIDFEDDQWTFFKPSHDEIRSLYGLDVQELYVWRPLIEHAVEHLAAQKVISTEANAFWLPDTAGTDYRTQHTKTTIVIVDIDVEKRELGYFHNASYHRLAGEDFVKSFRLDVPPDPTFLPLFAEVVRLDHAVERPRAELISMSRSLLSKHLARRPARNPVRAFGSRLEQDISTLHERGLPYYHAWAFGTIRQIGAAFELASRHLSWSNVNKSDERMMAAATAFEQISQISKSLILKVARAVNSRRPLNVTDMLDTMAQLWERGMDDLEATLGR